MQSAIKFTQGYLSSPWVKYTHTSITFQLLWTHFQGKWTFLSVLKYRFSSVFKLLGSQMGVSWQETGNVCAEEESALFANCCFSVWLYNKARSVRLPLPTIAEALLIWGCSELVFWPNNPVLREAEKMKWKFQLSNKSRTRGRMQCCHRYNKTYGFHHSLHLSCLAKFKMFLFSSLACCATRISHADSSFPALTSSNV